MVLTKLRAKLARDVVTRLKMIIPLRPRRSVSAPLGKLPMTLDTDQTANNSPTSVMPTLNFLVTYKAKKGKSSEPPRRSMKLTTTTV